jgi:hypothetical protein
MQVPLQDSNRIMLQHNKYDLNISYWMKHLMLLQLHMQQLQNFATPYTATPNATTLDAATLDVATSSAMTISFHVETLNNMT